MATILTRNASIYWSGGRVDKTRDVAIDMSADFKEDTVHGSTNKTSSPTFSNFNAKVTGLYNTGPAAFAPVTSAQIIKNALSVNSGYWSIYLGQSLTYFYGSGYVSVDNVGAPYDDFAPFDWTITPIGNVGHYDAVA